MTRAEEDAKPLLKVCQLNLVIPLPLWGPSGDEQEQGNSNTPNRGDSS